MFLHGLTGKFQDGHPDHGTVAFSFQCESLESSLIDVNSKKVQYDVLHPCRSKRFC